jgi:RNA polymerase sigma-70 factor (ECF subfamily)
MLAAMKQGSSTGSLPVLPPEAEPAFIVRCVRGERAAQDEFFLRYRRLVAGNLYRVLGDRSELEDLTQEVFVIAFRGLASFRGDARLTTWLYRICVNVALGRIRTRSRRPRAYGADDLDDLVDQAADGDRPETPAQALERQRDRERVYRALDAMAPKKRLVLYLHEIEGRDLKDIAYLLESNAVTIRTRLFYAKREFYALLASDGSDGAAALDVDGGEA